MSFPLCLATAPLQSDGVVRTVPERTWPLRLSRRQRFRDLSGGIDEKLCGGAERAINDAANEARGQRGGAGDAHLAARGIGKKFDVTHALPQLVEGGEAARSSARP